MAEHSERSLHAVGWKMGERVSQKFSVQKLVKIRILLILSLVIVFFGVGLGGITYFWPQHKARQLFFLATKRIDDLVFFMEKQRRSVVELARSVYMQDLMAFEAGEGETTKQQIKQMQSFLKEYQESFGYSEIFLINLAGKFVFSTRDDLLGKNIKDEAYKNSLITRSFEFIRMTLTSDNSDFAYDVIVKEEALFITMPVSFQDQLRGFLAVQISNDKLHNILRNYEGLGTRGEYVIASLDRDKFTFVLPPRRNPELAFTRRTLTRSLDLPIEKAVSGYEGYGVERDYQGKYIVAGWKFVPQFNWGLVAKVDYDRLMFFVYVLRYILYVLLFIMITLATTLMIKMMRPVQIDKTEDKKDKKS